MKEDSEKPIKNVLKNKYFFKVGALVVVGILLFGGYYGLAYASTPGHMRNPMLDHYHFRTQLLVDGKLVDFSVEEFQQEYDKDTCSADLNGTPIDFHDNVGQMTHVHWSGVTGGELLKYYGWNLIGGDDNSMGTRFDQGLMSMHKIPIYGDLLPDIPEGSDFYIYSGDEQEFQKRDWSEFLSSDLEDFFGVKSLLRDDDEATSFNFLDLFSGQVYAHGGADDGDEELVTEETEEQRLTRINNLIGNIVVFVQENEPTNEEVAERFSNLAPLTDSTCGG